ncbi:hypothetical protein ACJX0J_030588, partial [Zea mays]
FTANEIKYLKVIPPMTGDLAFIIHSNGLYSMGALVDNAIERIIQNRWEFFYDFFVIFPILYDYFVSLKMVFYLW